MSTTEQSFLLTEADRAVLSSKRTRALVMAPVMGGLSIIFLLLLIGLVLAEVFSLFLITLVLLSLVAGLKAVTSTISFLRLNRDLRERQKRFINAPVEAQDIIVPSGGGGASAYVFWIKAGGKKIDVSEEQYYKIKKGDLVQAYVAPHSNTVLGLSANDDVSSQFDAGPVPATHLAPPRKSVSKTTKRVLIAAAVVVVAAVIFLAVAGVVVMYMSEKTYNSLNPFSPKSPPGAFPETIAGYKQASLYFNDNRGIGYGYKFSSSYKSNRGAVISYVVIDYGGPEKVKQKLRGRDYLGGGSKVLQQTETRMAATDYSGYVVLLAAGHRLVHLSGSLPDLIEFENQLPYAALGINSPARRTVEDFREQPISVVTLFADFEANKAAAAQKYGGHTLLFSGVVTLVTNGLNNTLLVGVQKRAAAQANDNSLTAIFSPSEAEKVKRLTIGQEARFRCRVFIFTDTRNFSSLDNCRLEQ